MDRLDAWLNAQRGWLRVALLLAQTGPLCVVVAFGLFGMVNERLPAFGPVLAGVIALGLVAAVPVSLLQLWSHARRARNPRKKRTPLVTWRAMVYALVMAGPLLLIVISANASPEWHRQHHGAVDTALLILVPCLFLATIERSRYMSRLRRLDDPRPIIS